MKEEVVMGCEGGDFGNTSKVVVKMAFRRGRQLWRCESGHGIGDNQQRRK